jgi:hypothetical protein
MWLWLRRADRNCVVTVVKAQYSSSSKHTCNIHRNAKNRIPEMQKTEYQLSEPPDALVIAKHLFYKPDAKFVSGIVP